MGLLHNGEPFEGQGEAYQLDMHPAVGPNTLSGCGSFSFPCWRAEVHRGKMMRYKAKKRAAGMPAPQRMNLDFGNFRARNFSMMFSSIHLHQGYVSGYAGAEKPLSSGSNALPVKDRQPF